MAKARIYSEEALQTLVAAMRDAPRHSERCRAAELILDRAHGKPVAAIDVAEIRRDLKRTLESILSGGPGSMAKLAELRRRLKLLDEIDP